METTAPHALPACATLASGAYTIERLLGRGGFGLIYVGRDTRLSRQVAIKELFPEGCFREGATVRAGPGVDESSYARGLAKFIEEAAALARFRHPHIVAVHACIEENNTAYMVMEFLEGETLQALVQQRGPLRAEDAIKYLEQIGGALATVHGAALIHRDVNPNNVMICRDGRAVAIDFGLNRKIEQSNDLGTRQLTTTSRLGTAGYAALEQYGRNANLGPWTDIYALGATFYYALTGQHPAEAPDRAHGHAVEPPVRVARGVPHELSDAIMWAMEMKIEDRPQSIGELLAVLHAPVAPPVVTAPVDTADDGEADAPVAPPVVAPPTQSAPPLAVVVASPSVASRTPSSTALALAWGAVVLAAVALALPNHWRIIAGLAALLGGLVAALVAGRVLWPAMMGAGFGLLVWLASMAAMLPASHPLAVAARLLPNRPPQITTRHEAARTEPVPFPREERRSDDLAEGRRRVIQDGQNGVREVFVEVTLRDGREGSRKTRERVVKAPVPQITLVGTAERAVRRAAERPAGATIRRATSSPARSHSAPSEAGLPPG